MGRVWRVRLAEEFATEIDRLQALLTPGIEFPDALHHYTSPTALLSILSKDRLWGIPLDGQGKDSTEWTYGLGLLTDVINRVAPVCNCDTREILTQIPSRLNRRKKWFFISCFCADMDSSFHFDTYGSCRLTFPGIRNTSSYLSAGVGSSSWIQPVSYSEDKNRSVLHQCVLAAKNNLDVYVENLEDPWRPSMIESTVALMVQCFFRLLVCIKQPQFSEDREWRLSCSPTINPLAQSIEDGDESFEAFNVHQTKIRHVEFQYFPPLQQIEGSIWPPSGPTLPVQEIKCAWDPSIDAELIALGYTGFVNESFATYRRR